MKKSTRLMIILIVIEAVLLAIGAWLINGLSTGTLQATNSPEETTQTVFTVLGGAMGVIAAVVGLAVISMRRRGL